MIETDIQVDFRELDEHLAKIIATMDDRFMKKFLHQTGALVKKIVKRKYARGGDPEWEPLKPSTIERRKYAAWKNKSRRQMATGEVPLGGAEGTFAKSIRWKIDAAAGWVRIAPPRGLQKLVGYHAQGGPHLPKRNAYVLSKKNVQAIVRAIVKLMGKSVDKALGIGKKPARRRGVWRRAA